jgi:tight adherence protein C
VTILFPAAVASAVLLAGFARALRTEPAIELLLRSLAPPPAARSARPRDALRRIGGIRAARLLPGERRLARRLELAAARRSLQEVRGLRLLVAAAAGATWTAIAPGPLKIPSAPLMGMACSWMVDLSVARRARARQARVGAQVPDLVELLVATGEAGLGLPVAFRRSAEILPSPLGDELREAVRRMDLGVSWPEALRGLVDRTDAPSLRRLVGAVASSQRLGTPVRAVLRRVADDLRAERRAQAEDLARRAPVKMLFPLVFLILPAFLLLTVGPVLLATINSLHHP